MNNIRGSCFVGTRGPEFDIFTESPGYNTAIDFRNKYDYTDLAIMDNPKPNIKTNIGKVVNTRM